MATFLFKTEPGEYSFEQLRADKRATWDGITSNAALAHLRTAARGDEVLIYHTGDARAIVGLAEIVSSPREDPRSPGRNAAGMPKFAVVDIKPLRAVKRLLTLEDIKADERFKQFALVRQPRLSVMPVPPDLDTIIRGLTGL